MPAPEGSMPSDDEIARAMRALATARAPKTLCPSEVARHLSGDWRALMPLVRQVAADMVARGEIVVTQRGVAVDPLLARGPIRIGHR